MSASSVVIIGPAHPLRGGGITTFNERLARQFVHNGFDTTIYTFSLQYPSFLFPGKNQYSAEPAPPGLNIKVRINSINPFNWWRVGNELKRLKPDIVVVRYWLPFMGPCLGTILRRIRRNRHTRIICVADNIIPHEKRPGDKIFTRYFIKPVHAFIIMSRQVMNDLRRFTTGKPARLVNHPLYDNFGDAVSKTAARQHLELNPEDNLLLFFGFIRKYKGLDILLDAMKLLKEQPGGAGCRLLVAGEFYEDEAPIRKQIQDNGLDELVIIRNQFITDSEVKYYICAADCVVQPYRHATQSGVTPLASHFEVPMIVTNVGGLPDMVPHGVAGLVAEPNATDIAAQINGFLQSPPGHFLAGLRNEKKKYSWEAFTTAIVSLAAGNNESPERST